MEVFPLIYGLCQSLGLQYFRDNSTPKEISHQDVPLEQTNKTVLKDSQEDVHVRIISLNLWLHHLSFAPNMKKRLDRVLEKIKEGNYDILMIQELWLFRLGPLAQQYYVDKFITEIKKLGFIHHSNPFIKGNVETRFGITFGNNSGLLIASKYPIISSHFENFVEGKELLNFKGYLRSTIDINDNKIHFITCHLNSRKNPAYRTNQLKQIKREMEKISEIELKDKSISGFVVAGDWNICSKGIKEKDDGREYGKLCTLLHPLYDIYMDKKYKNRFTYFDDGSFRDHCFISPHFEIVSHDLFDWKTDNDISCSDHLGLEFEIKI